jgi:oligoribonuclease (3'-5' exoribonuclease)
VRVEGPVFAIHQSDELLGGMDAWNKGTHGKSGLIDKVKASTISEAEAEAALIAFLGKYVPKGKTPLCGNSIGQDRRFMERYMPKLEAFFHYRNIDVSTLKELAKRWKPEAYTLQESAAPHGPGRCARVHRRAAHYRRTFWRCSAGGRGGAGRCAPAWLGRGPIAVPDCATMRLAPLPATMAGQSRISITHRAPFCDRPAHPQPPPRTRPPGFAEPKRLTVDVLNRQRSEQHADCGAFRVS